MCIPRSFRRLTTLLCLLLVLGALPGVGTPPAASAQASTQPDVGDAPDSSNALGAAMTAYPGVTARFPTSDLPGAQPPGPRHLNAGLFYHLGNTISAEMQADQGADPDGVNNIIPNFDIADNDNDDGLFLPGSLKHCTRVQLRYRVRVTNLATGPVNAFVNLWADWDRSGAWAPSTSLACPGAGVASEWAMQNQIITLPGPGSYLLTTPALLVWNEQAASDMWMRLTLSDQPAPNADGRGLAGGYARGETEDYLMEGVPPPAIVPPNPDSTPIELIGDLTALRTFKIFLPLSAAPKTFDPGLTAPGGKLKEVDVAHIGGTPGGPTAPLIVSAVGTGATVKLSSWRLPFGGPNPVYLQDSPNITGYDVKLHVLTPDISPDLSYSLLVSAVRDIHQNLWLTTWRLSSDGTFTQLDTRGYGSNADVQVRSYAIGHRPLLARAGALNQFQVVTPIASTDGALRLITWGVNPATGAINGLQDSGDWGNPAADTTVDVARVNGDMWTGPYYVVSYRNTKDKLATNAWEVTTAGKPVARGSGASGVDIRGDDPVAVDIQQQAIAPLTNTGFVSAHTNNNQVRISSWENRPVFCSDTGCTLSPHLINDNSADLNPGNGIGLSLPAITSQRALLVDTLGATDLDDTETLFQKGNGQQGIASVTKVMTLIVALDAVQDGEVALNDEVVISAAAAGVGGSQMGLEEGEKQTLRTLLHGLMIQSGNDAALAIAEYVGGSQAAFTILMNAKVAALGMGSSIYCQAAGGCFSTTQDQVRLWLSAYKTSQFQDFAGSELYSECGETAGGEDKCYFLERSVASRYPGMESWKGGSLGFFCDTVPNTVPLCASGGCLSAQTTRLGHTLVLNELHPSSAETAADRWNDAYDLLDYGYRRLFTPDFRGANIAEGGPASDFAIDNVGDTRSVSAVLTPGGKLKLCQWQLVAGIGQIGLLACSERSYTNLPGGSQAVPPSQIDILRISTLEAEGDYLSGHLESGNLVLRAWRVAERP